MLEATEFRGWFYGTPLDSLKEDGFNVGVFNIAGIDTLLEDSRLEVYPVIVYAPDKTRLIRQLLREESPDCEEICRRFQTDNKDFLQCDFAPFFVWENFDEENDFAQEQSFIDNFCRLIEKIELSIKDD
jgi:guanylate kinase